MYQPRWTLQVFDPRLPDEVLEALHDALLEGLVAANEVALAAWPLPPLYESGVVYEHEGPTEEWYDVPEVLARGAADCEDLAAWRVAELRAAGVDAWACSSLSRDGADLLFHVRVCTPWGIEDPSCILGMPGCDMAA